MSKSPTREERMSDAFLVMGSQYFALAAFCSEKFYLPVGATLFHHAIEMLLKGFLANVKTSSELKTLGHDLESLWREFKLSVADANLSRFDPTITRLNAIELIRYPDSIVDKGYILNVRLGPPLPMNMPGTETLPQYFINVSDLNEIASTIFKAGNVPVAPYFKNTPVEIMKSLPATLQPST